MQIKLINIRKFELKTYKYSFYIILIKFEEIKVNLWYCFCNRFLLTVLCVYDII